MTQTMPTEADPVVVWEGDALEVLASLPDACVDTLVTDPPYFLPATHYATRSRVARSLTDLSILEHYFRDVFTAVRRVLKPDGFAYVFCDGQSYPVFYVTAYPHFKKCRPLVWDKVVSFSGYSWRHQHELILFCESDDSPAVPTGDGDLLRCRAVPIDDRDHLAEKPVELLRKLIAKTTPLGGLVLDPFGGSGATAAAAMREERRCLLIEEEPAYAALARRRVAEAMGTGLLAFTGEDRP